MKIVINATEENIEMSCTGGGRAVDYITAAGLIVYHLSKTMIQELCIKSSTDDFSNFCASIASYLCKAGENAVDSTTQIIIPIKTGENRNGN